MKFSNIVFFVASLLLAIAAGAFLHNVGVNLYGLDTVEAAAVGTVAGGAVFVAAYAGDLLPVAGLYMAISAKRIKRNPTPNNIGGLEDGHYYAFFDDIDEFPAALTPDFLAATGFGQLVTIPADDPFVMKTGKFFHKFPCTPEEGKVGSTLVGPHDSKGFENATNFGNAGNNDDLRGHIAYLANERVIILSKELNGTVKVVGTPGYPARLDTAEAANGGKVSDGNTIKHAFKSYAHVPCPTYLAPIPLDPTEA